MSAWLCLAIALAVCILLDIEQLSRETEKALMVILYAIAEDKDAQTHGPVPVIFIVFPPSLGHFYLVGSIWPA